MFYAAHDVPKGIERASTVEIAEKCDSGPVDPTQFVRTEHLGVLVGRSSNNLSLLSAIDVQEDFPT